MTATQSVVVGAGSALVAALGLWLMLRSRRKEQQPTRWRRAGQLSEILLYPLKSGRGLPLQQAECTELGLQVVGPGSSNLRDRHPELSPNSTRFELDDERAEEVALADGPDPLANLTRE